MKVFLKFALLALFLATVFGQNLATVPYDCCRTICKGGYCDGEVCWCHGKPLGPPEPKDVGAGRHPPRPLKFK
ncbi:unnamed protein product [Microthlaspi erraticum]|uniref:Uncharacterized protein n=1 Tax=Microthlaspi erraticum TaxID=1685480 RepID=A0A6D2I176_9BRAS|nr:unnamed protein product [Microthlaspi erraticum]